MDQSSGGESPTLSPEGDDAVLAALAAVESAANAVRGVNLWAGSDGMARDRVAAGARALAKLESAWLSLVGDLDTRPEAVPGARAGHGAAAFLRAVVRRSPSRARADVEAARALRDADLMDAELLDAELLDDGQPAPDVQGLPVLGAAFAAGEVSRDHVDVAVRAFGQVPAHLLSARHAETGQTGRQRVDELLTDHAREFDPKVTAALAKGLLEVLDPGGRDSFDPESFVRRELSFVVGPDGMLVIRGQADPASAAAIKAAIDHFSGKTPVCAEPEGDGDAQQALSLPDRRSAGQRRLDAFSTIARLAMGAPDTGTRSGEPPRIVVHTTMDQLADAVTHPATDAVTHPATDAVTHPATDAVTHPATDPPAGAGVGTAGRPADAASDAARRTAGDCAQTGPISQTLLARFACDAVIQAVVESPSGAILDMGRSVRTVTSVQRKAVIARDRGCVICAAPPEQCDVHHVRWCRNSNRDLLIFRAHGPAASTPGPRVSAVGQRVVSRRWCAARDGWKVREPLLRCLARG